MSAKRFRVALSFPGEKRDFIRQVADSLTAGLGKDSVLYDDYLTAELARPDLDLYLGALYRDESELLVPFYCADYERKKWCKLEWRQMRDIIVNFEGHRIMPFRFDDTPITGVLSIDGYVKIGSQTPQQVAELIIQRLNKLQSHPNAPVLKVAPTPTFRNLSKLLFQKWVLLSICVTILLVCLLLSTFSRSRGAKVEKTLAGERPVLEATLVVDSVVSNEVRYHFSIKNTGPVAAAAIRISEQSRHGARAQLEPPPFSQLMPGGTMSYGLPVGIKLDGPALAHWLTVEYRSGSGNNSKFQSSYRFWVLSELLKPGEFACIGANHDGSVPDAFDKSAIQQVLDQIRISTTAQRGEQGLPGLSLLTLVRIAEPLENRRQYLFDFGEIGKARLSIYVGPGKILTSVFVDAMGEPHPITMRVGDGGVPLAEFIYLACQIGVGDRTTMLRLSVNGKTVQTLNLQFETDLSALDFNTQIVGADLTKQNGAAFDLREVVRRASTMSELEINKSSSYFLNRPPPERYLQFNGEQWMMRDAKGNLIQPDKPLAPRLRVVTPK